MEKTMSKIEELYTKLQGTVQAVNACTDVKLFAGLKEKMDDALEDLNGQYIHEECEKLSVKDLDELYKLYVSDPSCMGKNVKQDKDSLKYEISDKEKKLMIPFATLVSVCAERPIVQKASWEKSIKVLRYCLAEASAIDLRISGKEAHNPLTPDADLYAYAEGRGWSLHGKKDKSGHYVGVSHADLKQLIANVAADILPESMSKKFLVCSADVNYLLRACCPAKGNMHKAKITVRNCEGVVNELFTAVNHRINKLEYKASADSDGKAKETAEEETVGEAPKTETPNTENKQ